MLRIQNGAGWGFLAELLQSGVLAERYFTDDPLTALFKVRQFAELLANEPASVLLKRLRTEQATAGEKAKRGKRRTAVSN